MKVLDLRAFNKNTIHILYLVILVFVLAIIITAIVLIFYVKPPWLSLDTFTSVANNSPRIIDQY